MIRTIQYNSPADLSFLQRDDSMNVTDIVRDILQNVRENGDAALYEYSKKFDKTELTTLEVTQEEIDEAFRTVEPEYIEILKEAKENIWKTFTT